MSTISTDQFRAVFGQHPAGAALITAVAPDGTAAALTVTSVISLSATPPVLGFSVSHQSSTAPCLSATERAVVHFLDAASVRLAVLGATSGVDRFADPHAWTSIEGSQRVFTEAKAWVAGRVISRTELPNATFCAVELESSGGEFFSEAPAERTPLVYHSRAWRTLDSHALDIAS